jgi:acetamidase/formamidase
MDFNQIAEGTTLYLAVLQPGALLYVGDGHALQGDGELNGNALETSMDIEFSVEVRQKKEIGTPRAENADFPMAMGLAGSLDNAFSRATSELATWLQEDYKLPVRMWLRSSGRRFSTVFRRWPIATLASLPESRRKLSLP